MRCDVSDPLLLNFPFYCSFLLIVVVMDERTLTESGNIMKGLM